MDELKVRITLGDTTLEGTLDELLESGTFKMEYDQAELDEIVKEKIEAQKAAWEAAPTMHMHMMESGTNGAHTFDLPNLHKHKYEVPSFVAIANGCYAHQPKDSEGLTGWVPTILYTMKKKEDVDA